MNSAGIQTCTERDLVIILCLLAFVLQSFRVVARVIQMPRVFHQVSAEISAEAV